jgi:hypothetical protein
LPRSLARSLPFSLFIIFAYHSKAAAASESECEKKVLCVKVFDGKRKIFILVTRGGRKVIDEILNVMNK